MVNIFGGKWTTYRQMAEDGVDDLHLVAARHFLGGLALVLGCG